MIILIGINQGFLNAFYNKKAVDLDQKSERVQKLVTYSIKRLLQIGNTYEIETSSFYMKYYILNISNNSIGSDLFYQSGSFKLPPFCDLVYNKNLNCSSINVVVLKVNKHILKFKLYLK
jgi:hypothetical protein